MRAAALAVAWLLMAWGAAAQPPPVPQPVDPLGGVTGDPADLPRPPARRLAQSQQQQGRPAQAVGRPHEGGLAPAQSQLARL